MATTIATRKYVADALSEELQRLYVAFAREGRGRRVGMFLQQSVVLNADEETLRKILTDVRLELAATGGDGNDQ